MKLILLILSTIIGGSAYGYLAVQTALGTGENLSFATFGMWSVLAWIAYFTTKKGRARLTPGIYAVGATTVMVILVFKGRFGWSGYDLFVASLVAICVWIWLTKKALTALTASTLAGMIAAIPLIIMAWQAPEKSPIISNGSFFIANTLYFFSGQTWKLEDRLYGAANAFGCSFLVIPWLLWALQ